MDPKILWSIALGSAFLCFALNAFWKSKTQKSSAVAGFVLWQALDNWIDLALYPVMIGWLGEIRGFAVMFAVTLVGNLLYLVINGRTEADWTLRDTILKLPVVRTVYDWKIGPLAVGKALGFAFFSIKFDSFTAIIYLYGKSVDLRKAKVWILFITSHVICNVAWTLLVGGLLAFAKILLKTTGF
ncbi:MAG TPA: hypothetical protein VHE10_00170 [Candidatus Paceibacterota bacterium]|nr:hypothetical protein [Candidatus Paceibacterota bacterium]